MSPLQAESRTACIHGHPWPQNLRLTPEGWVKCAECIRVRDRERYRRTYVPMTPDEVAIARAVRGDPPERLNTLEREAAIRTLTTRGLSARQIAEQLGCSERTVTRTRTRRRPTAA